MQRREQVSEFKEKLVYINRVAKVVKGGKNFRFTTLMVIGDEKGRVGCGMGKAVEIPEAVRKGIEDAKKQMITVAMDGTTIPHQVTGVFGTGRVLLMPAPEGTGVIAAAPSARSSKPAASRTSAPSRSAPTTRSTWSRPRWKA